MMIAVALNSSSKPECSVKYKFFTLNLQCIRDFFTISYFRGQEANSGITNIALEQGFDNLVVLATCRDNRLRMWSSMVSSFIAYFVMLFVRAGCSYSGFHILPDLIFSMCLLKYAACLAAICSFLFKPVLFNILIFQLSLPLFTGFGSFGYFACSQ